ncbi:transcription factor MafB-like [Dysidea avara]|uniref:transcription factor MafB-like n=1 Tax=Dysidea avara TaxID=196820 RepID=UPI003318FD64
MDHFSFDGPFLNEDASVPSVADLERLDVDDIGLLLRGFQNDNYSTIMDASKIKSEPAFEETPMSATFQQQRHFTMFQPQPPATPLYSPAFTSNQGSPASYTDEDYSEEDKSYAPRSYQVGGAGSNILNITDDQLAQYTARDINRLCKGCPEDIVKQLKKRRRTLKNRGYASNSRVRRMQQKSELESTKTQLQTEVLKVKQELAEMRKQRDYYKNRADVLARQVNTQK